MDKNRILQKANRYCRSWEHVFSCIRIRHRVAKYQKELIENACVLAERKQRIIERTRILEQEFIDTVYHPDRVGKLIVKYGISILGQL